MSLYADYIKERVGHFCIELEDGFITYSIEDDSCFVQDFFVSKDKRGTGVARELYTNLYKEVKNECGEIVCHVDRRTNGWELSRDIILNEGFRIDGMTKNLIYFNLEVK